MTTTNSTELNLDKDPVLLKIGDRVRQLRKSNPDYINYEVFAYKNNINKVTLSKIEKGENHNVASLIKIIRALDISIEDFFKGIE